MHLTEYNMNIKLKKHYIVLSKTAEFLEERVLLWAKIVVDHSLPRTVRANMCCYEDIIWERFGRDFNEIWHTSIHADKVDRWSTPVIFTARADSDLSDRQSKRTTLKGDNGDNRVRILPCKWSAAFFNANIEKVVHKPNTFLCFECANKLGGEKDALLYWPIPFLKCLNVSTKASVTYACFSQCHWHRRRWRNRDMIRERNGKKKKKHLRSMSNLWGTHWGDAEQIVTALTGEKPLKDRIAHQNQGR